MKLWARLALAAAFAWLALGATAECRIAFDLGSSGIRAGSPGVLATPRAAIDTLGPQWAGRGLEETLPAVIAALKELPVAGAFPPDCARLGGGFSAWRLALEKDRARLARQLAQIRAESGVAVLVMPQAREGAYGFFGARQALGERLFTSHILDIGGGSLQVAGAAFSFGAALGQKAWQRALCAALRGNDAAPCRLTPLSPDEMAKARALADAHLAGLSVALSGRISLTAISRPVSRGVLPAVRRLSGGGAGQSGFGRGALDTAITQLAGQPAQAIAEVTGIDSRHVAWLFSDLLLVEGVLRASGADYLHVAETDLTNLPGLLADEAAWAWAKQHDCYLERMRREGEDAFFGDPASCTPAH